MLQQPRVPPTGQRQAIEIQIKWREVLANQQALLKILSKTTGHTTEKLAKVSSCLQHQHSSKGRSGRPVLLLLCFLCSRCLEGLTGDPGALPRGMEGVTPNVTGRRVLRHV